MYSFPLCAHTMHSSVCDLLARHEAECSGAGILMTLLTLGLNTFIHTLVLIQLSFLVVTLTYIVTKIAIDSFYNRDVANPFRLVHWQ